MTDDRSTITSAGDASLRSWSSVAASLVLAAALALLPLLEPVRAVLGVDVFDVALSMGVFAATMITGALLYHRLPPGSRAFRVFDRVETALIEVAVLMLVYASGRGDSFFWLLVFVHIMLTGNYAAHARYHLGLFSTLPVLLAAAFVVGRGDVGAGALTLVIGALGVYVYWIALGVGRKLVAAEALRAHADRQRIARDIHDGIGADLAALDWRLRALHAEPGAPPALRAEVDALAGRLAQSADDLRAIVWAMRAPERRWSDLVSYLRQRARELAGESITVVIDDGGDGGIATRPGELALDYLRTVLELVRNAVRHAAPGHITVALRSSATALGATVTDDGCGLPADAADRTEGGLANLRHRTAHRGGSLVISPGPDRGTRIEVTFAA